MLVEIEDKIVSTQIFERQFVSTVGRNEIGKSSKRFFERSTVADVGWIY